MIALDTNFVTIKIDKDARAVIIIWKSFAKGSDYRSVLEKAVEIAQKYHLTSWVSDLTEAKVVSPQEKAWVEEEFIPRGLQTGIKKVAFIIPKDVFSKAYIDQIKIKLEKIKASEPDKYTGREVSYFETLNDALEWVKE